MTGYAFGARSLGFMARVSPALVDIAKEALAESPVDFGCTENQTRTPAEQAEKVRRGVSRSLNGPHVIKADGYGHALDLVPWIDGGFQWGDANWKVHTADGRVLDPFFDIIAAVRRVAIRKATMIRWGGAWDRALNSLPADPAGLREAVFAYAKRHVGSDLLDLPHVELL